MSNVKQKRSLTERDTELHAAFVDAYFEDTTILEEIPNGSALFLIPDDDPELAESNLQSALDAARQGYDVYIRQFPGPGRRSNAPLKNS